MYVYICIYIYIYIYIYMYIDFSIYILYREVYKNLTTFTYVYIWHNKFWSAMIITILKLLITI